MSRLAITTIVFSLFLTSCSWDPNGAKAQEKWLSQKNEEKQVYDKQVEESQKSRLQIQREEKYQFEVSHPEVIVAGVGNELTSKGAESLRDAYNSIPFVTRYPGTTDPNKVYTYVGDYKLNLQLVNTSVLSQISDCKRISAYADVDINRTCFNQIGNDLSLFASVIKDKNITGIAKKAALRDSTYGTKIDFGHAARLAKMHATLCQKQGGKGFVKMSTVAVPCGSSGDVINYRSAGKMGLIN
ncbi:TPA: hypothetical protein ACGP0T_000369 [Escherichia coli]|uniref:hypothetical protein n=1 Tax=Escherichia coli TaxID=562 RepID=UPI0005AA7F7B|nr:hypothetical protein [Escherichia coli]EFC5220603.1 hypothetical protein [Escherichia coli]EFK3243784.1 hypothetical protein [Escherichia coli]EGL2068545.1 hypothetical protein [Escherichia coli]EHE2604872.1 hypothetical protein [Escherichia coli]EIS6099947.1 hypothetical protein [Escherichia coli]